MRGEGDGDGDEGGFAKYLVGPPGRLWSGGGGHGGWVLGLRGGRGVGVGVARVVGGHDGGRWGEGRVGAWGVGN